MKKLSSIQFCILSVVSGVVTWLTFSMGRLAAHHWNEVCAGGKVPLPAVTVFATQYGYIVPLVCCLASIVCVVVSLRKPDKFFLLWELFTIIVVFELVGQGLLGLYCFRPALSIMYRLM